MPEVLVLSGADVAAVLDPQLLRPALETAMRAVSSGSAEVPARIAARTPHGFLGAMPGYVDDLGLATKLVAVFPDNRVHDLPSHLGLIALFDPETGMPQAIMDAEVITEVRTSLTAAIAADLLARADAASLAIVGAGAQARGHVRAFAPIRSWREVRVTNRSETAAAELAAFADEVVDGTVEVISDIDEAVAGVDVVALCTHADHPLFDPARIAAGTHVSSVGSAAELPPEVATAGRLVIEWPGAITSAPPAGAAELQHLHEHDAVLLGALLAGEAVGRTSANEVTVYKSTGHAAQDVAAARVAFDAAVAAGRGTVVTL